MSAIASIGRRDRGEREEGREGEGGEGESGKKTKYHYNFSYLTKRLVATTEYTSILLEDRCHGLAQDSDEQLIIQ